MRDRKRWAGRFDAVKYCSARCRRHRPGRVDRALEAAITELAAQYGRRPFSPDQAMRAVANPEQTPLEERTKNAVRRLASSGIVEMVHGARVLDPSTARGPYMIRAT
jgi:hypothetical protein